jgi:hypothetical protein
MQLNKGELDLNSFDSWAKNWLKAKPTLSSELVRIDQADPPCARVDVFSKKYAGRITIRLDGLCDVEIIESDTEAQVLYQHFLVAANDDLQIKFKDFKAYFCQD